MALNLMSPNPITIDPDADLEKALEILSKMVSTAFRLWKRMIPLWVWLLWSKSWAIINAYDSLLGYSLDTKSITGFKSENDHAQAQDDDPTISAILSNVHNQVLSFHQNLIDGIKSDLEHLPNSSEINLDLTNLKNPILYEFEIPKGYPDMALSARELN